MATAKTVRLPDGQMFSVTPVFAGLFFKSNQPSSHPSSFPVGWTIVINSEAGLSLGGPSDDSSASTTTTTTTTTSGSPSSMATMTRASMSFPDLRKAAHSARSVRRLGAFTTPTMQSDSLFISSVSNPATSEFAAPVSATRQIAMMLWVTLYWYFHQPEPDPHSPPPPLLSAELDDGVSGGGLGLAAASLPVEARPRSEWRVRVRKDGVLRRSNLIPKLERMGLIATQDSSVGVGSGKDDDDGWGSMFVSRRMFWQMPPRLFLYVAQPTHRNTAAAAADSPISSRPTSPGFVDNHPLYSGHGHGHGYHTHTCYPFPETPGIYESVHSLPSTPTAMSSSSQMSTSGATPGPLLATPPPPPLMSAPSFPIGQQAFLATHLPTYYPPPPLTYVFTDGVRHPLRPKPPRQGEIFYSRFIPSAGQYLSFRVASNSPDPVPYNGPVGLAPTATPAASSRLSVTLPTPERAASLCAQSDNEIVQAWLGNPRIATFWGRRFPGWLDSALRSQHMFPIIGLWDGVPFGYFEIYWAREDLVGRYVPDIGDWDRGFHSLIGEEWARARVPAWLSSILHWCWFSDYRTNAVCLEPRVDNARFIQHLQYAGFAKEREIALPSKQASFMRLRRDVWEGPAL